MSLPHAEPAVLHPPRWDDPRADRLRQASLGARWWYALKPASWPKLLVPAVLGQGAGALHAGRVSVQGLVVGAGFSVLLLVFIVLLNDWSDAEVDRVKRAMYPQGCSPKTIPDGLLSSGALLTGGLLALGLGLGLAFAGAHAAHTPLLGWSALACAGIFMAYSLPPLRLNYRGGGELLEALGVGFALPAWNALAQGGEALPAVLVDLLPAFVALSLASALASGLSDENSDRAGGKRTFTTQFGNASVRRGIEACVLLAAVLFVVGPWVMRAIAAGDSAGPLAPALVGGLVGAAAALAAWVRMRAVTPEPVTDAFAAQALFKERLHGAIWYGSLAVLLTRALMTETA